LVRGAQSRLRPRSDDKADCKVRHRQQKRWKIHWRELRSTHKGACIDMAETKPLRARCFRRPAADASIVRTSSLRFNVCVLARASVLMSRFCLSHALSCTSSKRPCSMQACIPLHGAHFSACLPFLQQEIIMCEVPEACSKSPSLLARHGMMQASAMRRDCTEQRYKAQKRLPEPLPVRLPQLQIGLKPQ
jgi:hypothetical protein